MCCCWEVVRKRGGTVVELKSAGKNDFVRIGSDKKLSLFECMGVFEVTEMVGREE